MGDHQLWFRVHAIARIHERWIFETDVRDVLENGQIIEEEHDVKLRLGFPGGRPIHVAAVDVTDPPGSVIITVYQPDPAQWNPGFRTRGLR